jgi:hypothetical protein
MTDTLTLTPDEYKSLAIARIEQMLAAMGLPLTETMRAELSAVVDHLAGTAVVDHLAGTAHPTAAVRATSARRTPPRPSAPPETETPALSGGSAGKRARVYEPTGKAKPVDRPSSTADKVLNLILSRHLCTLPDLVRGTHRPKKALYTAIWQLEKNGLIKKTPIAEMGDGFQPTTE